MTGRTLTVAGQEEIPAFDQLNAGTTLSLPQWVISRRSGLVGGMTIPAEMALTEAERSSLSRRRDELSRSLQDTPEASESHRKLVFAALCKMFLAYPAAGQTEASVKARAEVYMDALRDVPTWASIEAMRRWNRGEAGEQNYQFAPPPAVLHRVAVHLRDVAIGQIGVIDQLLSARVELDEATRAVNVVRLAAMLKRDDETPAA